MERPFFHTCFVRGRYRNPQADTARTFGFSTARATSGEPDFSIQPVLPNPVGTKSGFAVVPR